jgi:hypothetical protein
MERRPLSRFQPWGGPHAPRVPFSAPRGKLRPYETPPNDQNALPAPTVRKNPGDYWQNDLQIREGTRKLISSPRWSWKKIIPEILNEN